MRSTRTAKTTAACLVVLAGMFVGNGVASAGTAQAGTSVQADDMPWGVVKPLHPSYPGSAGTNGDMPWG
ncbi:hypothetical protein [Streptomyces sp. A0592]|uniref:hypothetical protein n=1 Tax=Streptomyces sp. A0592 TaxID=2563099 RepID=UPI00109EA7C1|nr:hypothetical protein [Streptomyces sp. A0592]THA82680.1 hypothetical protein E6U81_19210 [Streptomyces sp. A0592]